MTNTTEQPWQALLICCGRGDGTARFATRGEAEHFRSRYTAAEGHERVAIITGPADQNERDAAAILSEYLTALRADKGMESFVDDCLALLAKVQRDHIELRDAQTDLLNIRGILSPNGGPRAVPPAVQMVPNAAPAVEWLVNNRNMFRDRWSAALATAEEWRQFALNHRQDGDVAGWTAMAHALCCVLTALDGDDADKPATAPAPPPGSYWTDLNGKVWDLSCQYLDRHHRLWKARLVSGYALLNRPKDGNRRSWPLKHVEAEYGPLVAIPPKVELGHYGNGTHGGLALHNGKRKNCPAPECGDAEADEREEHDEETRRVRILLNSVSRFIETWAEADEQVRTDLWRGLSTAADPVADLFEARIADLDHRAAQLPDGGLASKP